MRSEIVSKTGFFTGFRPIRHLVIPVAGREGPLGSDRLKKQISLPRAQQDELRLRTDGLLRRMLLVCVTAQCTIPAATHPGTIPLRSVPGRS